TCSSLLDQVVAATAADGSTGIDAMLDRLGADCPGQYAVFVDFISIKQMAEAGIDECPDPSEYAVNSEGVALAERAGFCTSAPTRARWACRYSPTYNNDWHDDVVCSNGESQ